MSIAALPSRRVATVALALCAFAACGKKGPPLAPLRLVPEPVSDVSARRADDEVRLRFVLPNRNANGPGPVNLDRVEVYAATVAPGAAVPPNRELLLPKFVVGAIAVKPVPEEGEEPAGPPPSAPPDTRPSPGEAAVFVEPLTEEKRTPQFTTMPAAETSTAATAPAAVETAKPSEPQPLMRVYVVRGVTRGGRPGQPSARIQVPLVPPPAPPADLKTAFTSEALTLSWAAPADQPAGSAKITGYNVYRPGSMTPLNEKPLDTPSFERTGIAFGQEQCFVIRSVAQVATVTIESAPSAAACVTPADIFPPAQPKGLSAVASAGAINLIWDANTEADLAGYLVLRGEAPGDTLQPVTPDPIQGTTFRDTTVTPGVRYVYAVVAVDRATPPNVSAQSTRVEETAR